MPLDREILNRFHQVLVDEIRQTSPEYLSGEFTVAEIYQKLVPYGVHRDRIGVEMNGDYEDALLRLLAGEGDYLKIQSDPARKRIQRELESSNPNSGIYREFAAVGVRLNADRIPPPTSAQAGAGSGLAGTGPEGKGEAEGSEDARRGPPSLSLETPSPSPSGPHLFELADASAGADPKTGEGKEGTKAGPVLAGSLPRERGPATGASPSAADPGGGKVAEPGKGAPTVGKGASPEECPACDRDLPARPNLRFCPYCGVNVLERGCPGCGEPLEWGWAFCVSCGTQVEGT
jgi:hypothetical protein